MHLRVWQLTGIISMQRDILKSVTLLAALSAPQRQSAQPAPRYRILSWITQPKLVFVILPTTLLLLLRAKLAYADQDSISIAIIHVTLFLYALIQGVDA